MKEKTKARCRLLPLLLSLLLFFTGGCDSNEDFETFEGYETLKLLEWDEEWNEYFKGEWEFYTEFKNQHAWVKRNLLGNLGITIDPDDELVNFFPENVSQNLLKEDMEIIFSGEVRANSIANTYPLPLFIKNIQVNKELLSNKQ